MLFNFFIYDIIFSEVEKLYMDNKLRIKIFKILMTILLFLVILYSIIQLFPLIMKLSNESTREIAKNEISDMGIKGVFIVILLQVIQIIVAIIPGQPMEIISGMLYGTWGGLIVCLLGIFLGTTIVFYMVRKLGLQFIKVFFKQESIDKIRESKIYKNPQKFELLMFVIFCIPMVPKDIFIYLGGISPVRPNRFLVIATLGRIPGLFLTVFAGNRLSEGNIKVVIMLTVAILVIGIVGYFISQKIQNKLENEKIEKE